MYPELHNRDPNYDEDSQEEYSQDEEYSKANSYSSSDDDSQAVTNANAISNEHRKETRRMLRLSTSPRKKQSAKIKKKPKHWDVLSWKTLDPHPECLTDRLQETASDLLSKGKKTLKYDTGNSWEEESSLSFPTVRL